MSAWTYCPECGSEDVRASGYTSEDIRQCARCHQEWFTSIDYSDVVRLNLSLPRSKQTVKTYDELMAELRGLAPQIRPMLREEQQNTS